MFSSFSQQQGQGLVNGLRVSRSRRSKFPGRWLLYGLLLSLLTVAIYLWLTLLAPFGYHPPADYPKIDESTEHRVFVYGTLRRPLVRWLVIGRTAEPAPAILPDYDKQGLDVIPVLGAGTEGLVLEVSADELRRLDRYERLGIRYLRVEERLDDGTTAWVYRRLY